MATDYVIIEMPFYNYYETNHTDNTLEFIQIDKIKNTLKNIFGYFNVVIKERSSFDEYHIKLV
jgi:hypothetical protein